MDIDLVTLVVDDYDDALAFYTERVGFVLEEDAPATSSATGAAKRWVVVRPPGGGTSLLLAEAADDAQRAAVGNQTGGRVAFFLSTDDFAGDHRRMVDAGISFVRGPSDEPYGTVAVWEDLYGNRWDLIEPTAGNPPGWDAYPPADEVGEILYTEPEIAARVTELGAAIAADYDETPLLICVLKGSMVFIADLMRAITGPVELDFLAVSSYGSATKSSGVVRIVKDLDRDIEGRHVIIVEDIVDSGLTLSYLRDRLLAQRPASLVACTLLLREGSPVEFAEVPYVGFVVPPAFVVGYGLDVAQRYRNLPYIARYRGA